MRTSLLAAGLLVALLAAACGSGEPGAAEPPPVTMPAVDPAQLLAGKGTVLDDGSGPQLCLGGVAESYPPQCTGIPLGGWDWAAVDGEESASGTSWGDFRVVGTYDGTTLTVVEVVPYAPDQAGVGGDRDFTTPCPEPDGGWVAENPDRATEQSFGAGAEIAQALPGYVALWVDYVGDPTGEEVDQALLEHGWVPQIMNVVVTEDAAGAEAAIREAWGGPLCVTQREGHTEGELAAIRQEAERFIAEELRLETTWSAEGDVGLAAEVGVVVDPGAAGQAALDERYGVGMVKLLPALRPVESP